MHPKNPHQGRYDFSKLIQISPELRLYIIKNKMGEDSIKFDDPAAVKALNRALLKQLYGIEFWEIPSQFLCPPIPGRADYLYHLQDLLPGPKKLKGLDIGVGANCIYPLIGAKALDWSFVGSEIQLDALQNAQKIIEANHLENQIELRLQKSSEHIFKNILKPDEHFDFSICNPPFHSSADEAQAGSERKRKNLKLKGEHKLNSSILEVKVMSFGVQVESVVLF